LVTSVLFYGIEAWGYLKLKDHIELVHTSFLRQYLKVRKSTPLIALYGETGRLPLSYIGTLRILRYWSKLISLPENRYVKVAYKDAYELYQTKPNYSPWCSFIFEALSQISMSGHFTFQTLPNPNDFYTMARCRLFENYKNEWKTEIIDFSSLDSYVKFKPTHGLEEYLSIVKDKRHLIALSRFRLRSHNLAIESGRHRNVQRDMRFCVFCDSNQIEDEKHFLLYCSFYDELRIPLIPLISELTEEDAFVLLLHSTAPHIVKLVAKFVYQAFKKRPNLA